MEKTKKIQTILKGGGEWVDCEHKNWQELEEDGWIYCSTNPNEIEESKKKCVLMYRNGYMNQFREI